MKLISIEQLFISPGHNFFGHHGGPAGTNPLLKMSEIECVAGRGIRGDRFFDYKQDYKGQITFFSIQVFQEVCRELGISDKCPGLTRRNMITSGVDLNLLIGKTFSVQGLDFEGVCECKQALQGRGGLRARVPTSGILRVDLQKSPSVS